MSTTPSPSRQPHQRAAAHHVVGSSPPTHRVSGPRELIQAVPYLLGFHPAASLVLVGLRSGCLVVTARLDLADARRPGAAHNVIGALTRGGADAVVAVAYARVDDQPPFADELVAGLLGACAHHDCQLVDVLLTGEGRYRSLLCADPGCCPASGLPLLGEPSAFVAAATVDGMVALPDREAVAALLEPLADAGDAAFAELLDHELRVAAADAGAGRTRTLTRALFAAARSAHAVRWQPPADEVAARWAVALTRVELRDSVWQAVDDERIDGRPLWRYLARRCPAPFCAPALLLFGWASWRRGQGALAGVAADRAVASDPGYSAADLLRAALDAAIDPRTFPRIGRRRSA